MAVSSADFDVEKLVEAVADLQKQSDSVRALSVPATLPSTAPETTLEQIVQVRDKINEILQYINRVHDVALESDSVEDLELAQFLEDLAGKVAALMRLDGIGDTKVHKTGAGMAVEARGGGDEPMLLPDENPIRFGKPTGAFSTGATMTFDPCDAHGTDTGEDNVTVYVQADQSSYTMSNSTTVPTTEIVPFVQDAAGDLYVLGRPKLVMTDWQYDTSTNYYQKKTRDDWGTFCGTESAWVNVGDTTECDDT